MARIIAHAGFQKKSPAIKSEEKIEVQISSKGKKKASKKK